MPQMSRKVNLFLPCFLGMLPVATKGAVLYPARKSAWIPWPSASYPEQSFPRRFWLCLCSKDIFSASSISWTPGGMGVYARCLVNEKSTFVFLCRCLRVPAGAASPSVRSQFEQRGGLCTTNLISRSIWYFFFFFTMNALYIPYGKDSASSLLFCGGSSHCLFSVFFLIYRHRLWYFNWLNITKVVYIIRLRIRLASCLFVSVPTSLSNYV